MPDRATILAATPKCPRGLRPGQNLLTEPHTTEPCGQPLHFDAKAAFWSCPVHGNVVTPQSLVHRQTPTVCA